MYCPSCGSAVKPNLSFCSQCGFKVTRSKSRSDSKPNEPTADGLVWAMVSVLAVGLGGTIGLMAVMKAVLDFNDGLLIAFSSLSLIIMLIVESVLVWMLANLRKNARDDEQERLREQIMMELPPPPVRIASTAPTAAPVGASIIEHTTHSLQSTPE